MDILKAEIERKRKQLTDKSLIGPQKKYFKREELIQKLDDDYYNKQLSKHSLVNDNANQLNHHQQLDNNYIQSNDDSRGDVSSHNDDRIMMRKEVIKRLRDRNEPILLYGETEFDAFQRLKKLEILEPETADKGFRNDFQEAMEAMDASYLNEILKSGGESGTKGANDVKVVEMDTDIDEICRLASHLGKHRDSESVANDSEIILKFLQYLLELWGKKINSRTEKDKTSTQGKIESATYTQTVSYLRPLFKQLKTNKVADDIIKHLTIIVKHLLGRDYIKASDAYLQMAIGNAPWPIGVTMVGIHARTGREKIFSQNIAHVLNDETQRKYIQALKRLMTQCQRLFPTDPSRCVEFHA